MDYNPPPRDTTVAFRLTTADRELVELAASSSGCNNLSGYLADRVMRTVRLELLDEGPLVDPEPAIHP